MPGTASLGHSSLPSTDGGKTGPFQMFLAYFLPPEAHSEEEEASDVSSSDGAQTETDDTLPARKGHVQTLLDGQLPLY